MNNNFIDDVIDLTSTSFTLVDHGSLSSSVIEIDDDSFIAPCEASSDENKSKDKKKKDSVKKNKMKSKDKLHKDLCSSFKPNTKRTSECKTWNCPICWDELGTNPLAATKCGHVFCIKCLEDTLKVNKRCPTCRLILKGKTAYHPLYLSKD